MSKFVPSEYTYVDTINYRTRQPIWASDWDALVAGQNYIFANSGEIITGKTFRKGITLSPFIVDTGSTSWTVNSTNGHDPLDWWSPTIRLAKPETGANRRLAIGFYAKNCRLLVRFRNARTNSSIATIRTSAATLGWAGLTSSSALTTALTNGGKDPIRVEFQVTQDNTANPLELYQIDIFGVKTSAANLPTDPTDFQ